MKLWIGSQVAISAVFVMFGAACADDGLLPNDDDGADGGDEVGTEEESGEEESTGSEEAGTSSEEESSTETSEGEEESEEESSSDDTSTEDEGESTSEEEGEEESTTGEPLPEGFCEDACTMFAQGGCLTEDACASHCEAESPGWSEALGEAFVTCVETNPLCFMTIEDCMFEELHPPGSTFELALTGVAFEDQEGLTVRAWSDPDGLSPFEGEAQIEAGAFALEWSEDFSGFGIQGPLVLYYVDVDDDGSCDPDVDLTGSQHLEWDGDLVEPSFAMEVSPATNPAPFICGFLP